MGEVVKLRWFVGIQSLRPLSIVYFNGRAQNRDLSTMTRMSTPACTNDMKIIRVCMDV